MVVKIAEGMGLEIKKLLEGSEPGEINGQAVLEELYPKKVVKKSFAKPKATGKGPRRIVGGAKFQSGGASDSDPTSPSPSSPTSPSEELDL